MPRLRSWGADGNSVQVVRLEKEGYEGEDFEYGEVLVQGSDGKVIRCPYCGSGQADCSHSLALIDRSSNECENGYAHERFHEFRRAIEEYFLQQLREGTRNVSGRRDKLIGELWNHAVEKHSPGDKEMSFDGDVLADLIINLFEKSGGWPRFFTDAGPFSSAMCMCYAKKPKTVFEAALAELRARLKKAKLPKSKAGRTMPVDKPMRQSPTSEREVSLSSYWATLRRKQKISNVAQLEEANFRQTRLGKRRLSTNEVTVELVWERSRSPLRAAEPWDEELLIDPAGKYWSGYSPLQVFFKEESGKIWRFPRRWVPGRFEWLHQSVPIPDSRYHVATDQTLMESIHLPTYWDLLEINIPCELASAGPWGPRRVAVRISPCNSVRVTWSAQPGAQYMIPHTWRRRRVQLPNWEKLTEEGVPRDVATQYSGRVVSVNYHPGSLCCLPEHYRFRDEERNKWRVKIRDCFLIGYGDAEEHPA